uniref:Uncharacterized protein n=1 Tax=Octopus bimaculoides TaxID=37653 RepID=A0A0L8FP31_OCTBM
MYRNSLKNECLAFQLKPPKPPSWRDFVTNNQRVLPTPSNSGVVSGGSGVDGLANSGSCTVGRGDCTSDHSYSNSSSPRRLRRVRAPPRIHRTRSHVVINEKDLPDDTLMVSLAEAKLEELRLGGYSNVQDERIYLEENSRRCWNWLDSIKTCEPLDEIVSSSSAVVTNVVEASAGLVDIQDADVLASKPDEGRPNNMKADEDIDVLSCSATNSSFSHGNESDVIAVTDSDGSSFIDDIDNEHGQLSDRSSNGEHAASFCDTARVRKLPATKRISSGLKKSPSDNSMLPTAPSNMESDADKPGEGCSTVADVVDQKKPMFAATVEGSRSPSNENLYKLLNTDMTESSNTVKLKTLTGKHKSRNNKV